ncbi:MAG: hypothetical protein HWN66_20625, partial [Candidatus Helarchaeota archaeon]|nr:hypothetical protein [Candidatus Helarchaeota archaeon]
MQLLQEFGRDTRIVYGAIFTTFPINPVFFENVIRRELIKKNCRKNAVILLDSISYYKTMLPEVSKSLNFIGNNYHLAPIQLMRQKVFHPKIFFFTSKNRVKGYVG